MPITFVSVLGTGTGNGCSACLEGAWLVLAFLEKFRDLAKTQRQAGFSVPADLMMLSKPGLVGHPARAHTLEKSARDVSFVFPTSCPSHFTRSTFTHNSFTHNSFTFTYNFHTPLIHRQLFHIPLFHRQLFHAHRHTLLFRMHL
jgi:hypothetical protein